MLAGLLLLGACGGGPTSDIPGPVRDPVLTVAVPSGGHAGEEVVFGTSIEFGMEPFSLDATFGGGAAPDQINDLALGRSDAVSVTLAEVEVETSFQFTFYLTSAYGATDSYSGTFHVLPAEKPKAPPVIDSAVLSEDLTTLTVAVSDPDSDAIEISVATPEGVTSTPLSQTVASGSAAQFELTYAGDPPEGGFGALAITAEDSDGLNDTAAVPIPENPGPGPQYEPNALYAVPQDTTAAVDEAVVIVVRTGPLPNPFQFLNGVRVTVDSGAEFEPGSFNVGAPGGAAYEADGLWSAMDPVQFIEPPSSVNPVPANLGDGRIAFDFGLAPVVGSNLDSANGELFNFALRFTAPGTYTLGFQADDGVARTYYGWEDGGVSTTVWGDIGNNQVGVANKIVVTGG